MEPVDQPLLQAARTSQGETGEHATVQAEGHRGHRSQHGYAENAANPLLDTQRTLHGRKDTAAGEQGNCQ